MPNVAKWKRFSEQEIQTIVATSLTHEEIANKLGYKAQNGSALKALSTMYQTFNIDISHLGPVLTSEYKQGDVKQCTQCKQFKDALVDYYWSNGKTRNICKECVRKGQKEKYHTRKQMLDDYKKAHPCAKCGESRIYLLDFHHRDPLKKDYSISDNTNAKFETLMQEINKCILLCANCHREFHYLNQENPEYSIDNYLS